MSRAVLALCVAGALAQAAFFARTVREVRAADDRAVAVLRPLEAGGRLTTQPGASARIALTRFAERIPEDEPVLLVAGLPMLGAWDFYLLPRPLRVLVNVDPSFLEQAARADELSARQLEEFYGRTRAMQLDFTPERLALELDRSRWLVALHADAGTAGAIQAQAARLEPVDGSPEERAQLYRVRGEDE